MDEVRWEPVGKYHAQEIFNLRDGGSRAIEIEIYGRSVTMRDSDGHAMAMMLRPDAAICRQVPARAVPVEAIRTIVYALEAWWTYGADAGMPSQTEIRDVDIVRAWLDEMEAGSGSNS